MSAARRRLPYGRGSQIFDVESCGLCFTVTASHFDDQLLAEVFTQNYKADSTAGILASDMAIAASLALQFGCPPEVLRKALKRDGQGKASSPLGRALELLQEQNKADAV